MTRDEERRPGVVTEAANEDLAKSLLIKIPALGAAGGDDTNEVVTSPDDPRWRAAGVLADAWGPALSRSHYNPNSPTGQVGDATPVAKAPAVITLTALDMEAIAERYMALGWREALDALWRACPDDAQSRSTLVKVARMTDITQRRVPDHRACPARCKKCARCIHAFAWWARGQRPYLGVDAERALREGRG